MKDGDTVIVTADTEDSGALGVLRGQAEIQIGGRTYTYRIVTFPDGHEGAYEDRELRVIDEPPARNPAERAARAATPALAAYWGKQAK